MDSSLLLETYQPYPEKHPPKVMVLNGRYVLLIFPNIVSSFFDFEVFQ